MIGLTFGDLIRGTFLSVANRTCKFIGGDLTKHFPSFESSRNGPKARQLGTARIETYRRRAVACYLRATVSTTKQKWGFVSGIVTEDEK